MSTSQPPNAESRSVSEDLQIESPIGYVRSKARGELQIHLWMTRMAQSKRKVATVVLRPGHIFGALEDLDVMAADALAGFLRKFPPVQLGPSTATMSLVSVPTVVEAAVRAAQNAQKVSGRCFAVKDLDANFFRFYHESVLGRRIWPLRVPGFVLFFAAMVEDFVYWLTLVALVHWLTMQCGHEMTEICPSTTCMRQHNLSVMGPRPTGELARRLQALAYEAQLLLEVAATLADKVVVVTNAEEGWVNLSCRAWLPELLETLEKCEVASARLGIGRRVIPKLCEYVRSLNPQAFPRQLAGRLGPLKRSSSASISAIPISRGRISSVLVTPLMNGRPLPESCAGHPSSEESVAGPRASNSCCGRISNSWFASCRCCATA
eukprot:s578_g5.t1